MRRFQQPVAVYYDTQRIILRPSDIDFEVDVNAMVAEAVPYGEGIGFWRPFLGEVFDRPVAPVDIPLKMTLRRTEAGGVAATPWPRRTTPSPGRPTAWPWRLAPPSPAPSCSRPASRAWSWSLTCRPSAAERAQLPHQPRGQPGAGGGAAAAALDQGAGEAAGCPQRPFPRLRQPLHSPGGQRRGSGHRPGHRLRRHEHPEDPHGDGTLSHQSG